MSVILWVERRFSGLMVIGLYSERPVCAINGALNCDQQNSDRYSLK